MLIIQKPSSISTGSRGASIELPAMLLSTSPQPRTPSVEANPRHVQWTFTACFNTGSDATQKPSSIDAGSRGANNATPRRSGASAPSRADVIPEPRTPSAEANINPRCLGMCSGHSPPAAVYWMLYRSLHRSAQEAAAPRNSRAPRRIRRAANPCRYSTPAPNPIGGSYSIPPCGRAQVCTCTCV